MYTITIINNETQLESSLTVGPDFFQDAEYMGQKLHDMYEEIKPMVTEEEAIPF